MFKNLLKIFLIINMFDIYYSYLLSLRLSLSSPNNKLLNLKPKTVTIKLPNNRYCSICKLNINIWETIPENCTLAIGCPFNKKTNYDKNDTFKG